VSSRSEFSELVTREALERTTEEYSRSACEAVKCDWKISCVIFVAI
jgi:hypothetical protein